MSSSILLSRRSSSLFDALESSLGMDSCIAQIHEHISGDIAFSVPKKIVNKDIFVLHEFDSEALHTDFMQLLLLIQELNDNFARSVTVVIPYFPFTRYAKTVYTSSPSGRLVFSMLHSLGVRGVITVHCPQEALIEQSALPVMNIEPFSSFSQTLSSLKLVKPLVITPHEQQKDFAKYCASKMGCSYGVLSIDHDPMFLDSVDDSYIEGADIVIVDACIDTASTLVQTKKMLLDMGAMPDMHVIATHGVFSGQAEDRLNDTRFASITVTDTVFSHEISVQRISIVGELSDAIRSLC